MMTKKALCKLKSTRKGWTNTCSTKEKSNRNSEEILIRIERVFLVLLLTKVLTRILQIIPTVGPPLVQEEGAMNLPKSI